MLKSLDLFGFKSFADRTTFDFAKGITCIVGPNGSGKSNVVDAIKWILGDQSAKSLRGKEMTDVIFNGSGGRKPTGFAEATLTFDNSKRILAVDSFEVTVGRRIYRTGEAEYLINRVPARLKDVRDMFMGTGAGTSAYSIIEQGRVDALLQTTTVNRRAVFEEAAGISRFKTRKQDALRKLERVAQNLLRLTDIVEEVRVQLESLRSQAAKAMRYREYTEELKMLRIGLAADDYRELSSRALQIDLQVHRLSAEMTELSAEHQVLETEQSGIERQLTEFEDRLREVEKVAAENREACARHEATIQHQQARKTELEAELLRLKEQEVALSARAQVAVGELEQTVGDLESYAANFGGRKAALDTREAEIRGLTAAIDTIGEQLEQDRALQLRLVQEISVLEHRLADFQSQSASRESSRQRAAQRRQQLDREIGAAQAELERSRLLIDQVGEQGTLLRSELQLLRSNRDAARLNQEQLQRSLSEEREQRSAGHARRSLLDDLERRQEGLGIGVKEILGRAQEARKAPWNTVLGSVADLLVVDLEHAALLEVALGSRAQTIVLAEYGPLIEYLNQGKVQISGRVGFVAVTQEAEVGGIRSPGRPDLSGLEGVVNRADRLVKSTSGPPDLAEQLLSDTWIMKSLSAALELAATVGKGARFVTMQGELLEPDGSLYVGALGNETALVSRKSELRGLKQDLLRLDKQIAGKELELTQLAQSLAEADQQIGAKQIDLEQFADRIADLKSKAGSQDLDLERLRRDQQQVVAEMQQWLSEQQQLAEGAAHTRGELETAQAEREPLRQRLNLAEQTLVETVRSRRELQEFQAAEQLELAKQEERLHNLQHARTRLDQERAERGLQQAEAERRSQLVVTKREQIDQHLSEARADVGELVVTRNKFAERIAALQAEKDQTRESRASLAEREMRVRHQRRELKEQHHSCEMQTRDIQQQLEHLAERVRDEYQIPLIEAVAAGASIRQVNLETNRKSNPSRSVQTASELETADATESDIGNAADEAPELEVDGAALSAPLSSIGAEQTSAPVEIGPVSPEARASAEEKIDRLRRKLKLLGNINTDSLRDLDEMEARYTRLSAQLQDLVEAKTALEEIVRRINGESKRMFAETFAEIRKHFQELFRKLFGGGEGDVVLEDPEDVLECGIDVVARPPGKELRSISLLSGGEKTLTAVALLLAIFQSRPSPFCILDEVDAALDEGNVERYMRVIQEFRETTQFIVITHSKRTMTAGDVIYGVTMEEAGISKRMSVRFEDVSEDGNFKTNRAANEAA